MYFHLKRAQLRAQRVLGLQTLNPDMEQCVGANETESFTLAASVGVFVAAGTEAATGFKCLILCLCVCVCLRSGNVCIGGVDWIFFLLLSATVGPTQRERGGRRGGARHRGAV